MAISFSVPHKGQDQDAEIMNDDVEMHGCKSHQPATQFRC